MRSVLGTRAAMQDLAMIFRMSGHSTATSSMRSAEKHNTSSNALKDEMVKICESDGHNALLGHEETHVRVSCIMDQEKWECLIPKEYLEFATSIFNALEQEEGINREVLCATKRGGDDFILFRDVFIFVFCRKYSDATEKFLAYILGRSYHSPISHSFYRQSHYLDPATQKSDEAIRFNTLVEKIKKKVL